MNALATLPPPAAAERAAAAVGALGDLLPRLARLRGAVVVVKYGGAAMVEPALADGWAADVALLAEFGVRPVVVHGGGPALTRMLDRLGVTAPFVDGHRTTTAEVAEVAEMVLSGRINKEVVARLVRAGAKAVGLSGTDAGLLTVRPYRPRGRDLGFVGEVAAVDTALLATLLAAGYTPVLSSTAADAAGQTYNVNADFVAGAVAGALGAAQLIFLTDVPGVLSDGVTLAELSADAARALLENGGASGGMRPKLEAALAGVDAGVSCVHLADGRQPHTLLHELLGNSTGTRVVAERATTEKPR